MPINPCPFCGPTDAEVMLDDLGYHLVFCNSCRTQGPKHHSEESAIAAWNSRKTPAGKIEHGYTGALLSADFEADTLTFKMDPGYSARAGKHLIVPV